jgi:hypothetical protein
MPLVVRHDRAEIGLGGADVDSAGLLSWMLINGGVVVPEIVGGVGSLIWTCPCCLVSVRGEIESYESFVIQ